jgi:hypothetical protein
MGKTGRGTRKGDTKWTINVGPRQCSGLVKLLSVLLSEAKYRDYIMLQDSGTESS